VARINLTLPDNLYNRYVRFKNRINVSGILQEALEVELDMVERGKYCSTSPDTQPERLRQFLGWLAKQDDVMVLCKSYGTQFHELADKSEVQNLIRRYQSEIG
jgi:hypothetical protein